MTFLTEGQQKQNNHSNCYKEIDCFTEAIYQIYPNGFIKDIAWMSLLGKQMRAL